MQLKTKVIPIPKIFFPVPTAPAVVQGQMTSTWAHLPSRQSGKVYIRPALLNRLTVGPTDALCVVERIICLA
jgi:hypothetical protein